MITPIPFPDMNEQLRCYVRCWRTFIFAGMTVNEGRYFSPVSIRIWASETEPVGHEDIQVFQPPQLPQSLCLFKVVTSTPRGLLLIDEILQKQLVKMAGIEIAFGNFNCTRTAFVAGGKPSMIPDDLHEHVDEFPFLVAEGTFLDSERLRSEFAAYFQVQFEQGSYGYPDLLSASNHLIGVKVSSSYQWGYLCAALKIPIKLEATMSGLELDYKLEVPGCLAEMPIEMRYRAKSDKGERYVPIMTGKIGRHGVFSSSVDVSPGDTVREVQLSLANRRVHAIPIQKPEVQSVVESRAEVRPAPRTADDKKKVFVVHGRNEKLRKAMFDFLRSLDLKPLEWSQAVKATKKPSPYIGEILESAFKEAQAIVVLLSGDDQARLREEFVKDEDPSYEKELTPQPRPNVLFEAGIAMGRSQDRTILVEIGKVRPWSDIAGKHVTYFDGSAEKRNELAVKLETAGCDVDTSGQDWLSTGDFQA